MIKSNSDHELRTDSAAVKLATMAMANSSGNLILSACKRNSLCTCEKNENHLIKQASLSFCEEAEFVSCKQNCTEHQTGETKKCKLIELSSNDKKSASDHNQPNMCSNNQQSSNNSNQASGQQSQNDGQAIYNRNNNEINQQQQQNNDQDHNGNNDELNRNLFQMPNQMVDINNNIIEPELMLIDENNNLINLPDANFDMNNNYIWNNNNNANLDQQPQRRPGNQPPPNDRANDQQQNQQNQSSNNNDHHTSQQNLALLKDKLNCSKSNCKSTPTNGTPSSQSVHQIRQRKKLLELDLNKPRTNSQFYSPMNDQANVIKEDECSTHYSDYVLKRSASSGRRKKSIQCKKCLTKHLTKSEHSRCEFKNENSKCEHYHSMDCSTPEAISETKKVHNSSKAKANTPITLCPVITTPTIKEQLVTIPSSASAENLDIKQANKSNTNNSLLEQANSIISAQCPICLSMTIIEPCKPNNCSHSFCETCVLEWAKIVNECPLCRKRFSAILNKSGSPLECSINLQADRDRNFEFSQSALENILSMDDLNWPIIASAFLNQTSQGDSLTDQQQCEQINSILNSVFGHLEPQNMDLQWPF